MRLLKGSPTVNDLRLRFEHTLAEILAAQNLDQLKTVIRELLTTYRLHNIVLHVFQVSHTKIENPVLLLTYPDEWVKRYVEKDYFLIDPIVRAGKRGFLPFDWMDVDRDSAQVRQLFREADEYEIGRQGLTLPVRGPCGERSLFSVTANLSPTSWSEHRYVCLRELQVLAHYLHDRTLSLAGYRTNRQLHRLSRREQQCLQMISSGLLPKQVAVRLGLSESAVRLYIRSARLKLHAKTTNHAIAKAVQLEMLDPTDGLPPSEINSNWLKNAQ